MATAASHRMPGAWAGACMSILVGVASMTPGSLFFWCCWKKNFFFLLKKRGNFFQGHVWVHKILLLLEEKKIFFLSLTKKLKKNLPKVPDTLARVTKAKRVILKN